VKTLLFMSEGSDGAQMNYRRYVLERLLVGVGEVRQPDDERCSRSLVNRITEKDVQAFNTKRYRYTGEPICPFRYELFHGHFYAASWPKLCRCSGVRFERPTPEEYGAYLQRSPAGRPLRSIHGSSSVGGWSMRVFGQTSSPI
jgi:hypothetical protein